MLPSRVTQAFDAIRKGKTFPFIWLATVTSGGEPRVRTMKMCGFNLAEKIFYLSTHQKSKKIQELQMRSLAQLCLVDFELGLQLRFDCKVGLFPAPPEQGQEKAIAMRERFWQKLSPRSKIDLYNAHPQQQRPPETFILLQLSAQRADLLELNGEAPQRFSYPDLGQPDREERLSP